MTIEKCKHDKTNEYTYPQRTVYVCTDCGQVWYEVDGQMVKSNLYWIVEYAEQYIAVLEELERIKQEVMTMNPVAEKYLISKNPWMFN